MTDETKRKELFEIRIDEVTSSNTEFVSVLKDGLDFGSNNNVHWRFGTLTAIFEGEGKTVFVFIEEVEDFLTF